MEWADNPKIDNWLVAEAKNGNYMFRFIVRRHDKHYIFSLGHKKQEMRY